MDTVEASGVSRSVYEKIYLGRYPNFQVDHLSVAEPFPKIPRQLLISSIGDADVMTMSDFQ